MENFDGINEDSFKNNRILGAKTSLSDYNISKRVLLTS